MLLNFVLLNNDFIAAQKSISKEDFEHFVDYVNCKCVQVYIEKKYQDRPEFEKVRSELSKVRLDTFRLDYDKLNGLLSGIKSASRLAETINSKKAKYDNYQSDSSLIELLRVQKWDDVDLGGTAATIINEISAMYGRTASSTEQPQVQEHQSEFGKLKEEIENLKNHIKEYEESLNYFKHITYSALLVVFLCLIAVFLYFLKLTSKEFIVKKVLDSASVKREFNSINTEISILRNKQARAEPKDLSVQDIEKMINERLMSISEPEKQQPPEIQVQKTFEIPIDRYKYLKGKSGNTFSRLENSPENSFFRLIDEGKDSAEFEFFGDEAEAIAKRVFSDDICSILSGSYESARSVNTKSRGKIKRIGDQWEVIERAEIELK